MQDQFVGKLVWASRVAGGPQVAGLQAGSGCFQVVQEGGCTDLSTCIQLVKPIGNHHYYHTTT
jgi:hypothetical protein